MLPKGTTRTRGTSHEGSHPRAQPRQVGDRPRYHDPKTGQRNRKWFSFSGNKRGAQVECSRLISELKRGTALDPAKVTLREYLERWLAHIATQVSPRSCRELSGNRRAQHRPALGNVLLSKLRPDQIRKPTATP